LKLQKEFSPTKCLYLPAFEIRGTLGVSGLTMELGRVLAWSTFIGPLFMRVELSRLMRDMNAEAESLVEMKMEQLKAYEKELAVASSKERR
jgi:hypothetical protein